MDRKLELYAKKGTYQEHDQTFSNQSLSDLVFFFHQLSEQPEERGEI